MQHVIFVEDEANDIVEIEQYCSFVCYPYDTGGEWPTTIEDDSCAYCKACGDVISHGITECEHAPETGS
mgnify:CR=1 FL=1